MEKSTDLVALEEVAKGIPSNGKGGLKPEVHAQDVMTKVPWNILDNFIPTYLFENPDPIVQLEGSKGYGIYEDMTLHPVIAACWNLIVNKLTGLEYEWVAASEDKEDIDRRDWIKENMERLNSGLWRGNAFHGGMSALLMSFIDGIRMGCAFPQAIWNLPEARIVETTHEIPQAFSFQPEEANKISTRFNSFWTGTTLYYRSSISEKPQPAPPYKFMHAVYRPQYGDPHGKSAFQPAYWPYIFGFLEGTKNWVNFLDTWAQPTLMGMIDEQNWRDTAYRDMFMTILNGVQRGYRVTLPRNADGSKSVELLESQRQSSNSVFGDFYSTMNRLICMALVGSPLIMMESEFGTRAQTEVQSTSVFQSFVKGWADYLMQQMMIPIIWQCDLKYGSTSQTKYPFWKLKYEPPSDLKLDSEVDQALIKMGAKIPVRYLHEHYGRPQPKKIMQDNGVEVEEPLAKIVEGPQQQFGAPPPPNYGPLGNSAFANAAFATATPKNEPGIVKQDVKITEEDDLDEKEISVADLPRFKNIVLQRAKKDVRNFLR